MRNVTAKDLYQFEWPSNPKFSPNGQCILYEKTEALEATNDYETQIWLVKEDGTHDRMLTTNGTRNTQAIWSPDGKSIAYLSNQSVGMQVWIKEIATGEEKQLTFFKNGVGAIAFLPDGKSIVATTPVRVAGKVETFDSQASIKDVKEQITAEQLSWKNGPKRISTLHYKMDEVGLLKDFTMNLVEVHIETGDIHEIQHGPLSVLEFTLSPDGEEIAFTAMANKNGNPLYEAELYQMAVEGGEVKTLFSESKVTSPSYSPDGRWISFLAGNSIHRQCFILPSSSGDAKCISKLYPDTLADLSFTDMRMIRGTTKPQWSDDAQYIYALSTYQGSNEIVRLAVDGNEPPTTVMGGARTIFQFHLDGKEKIVAAYSSPNHPGKVVSVKLDATEQVVRKLRKPTEDLSELESFFPSAETRLDACNETLLSEIKVSEQEAFTFSSVDGWQIQGFLLKPVNVEEEKKYPIILDVHGGPHSMHAFTYFHQLQQMSAEGFAVIYINPRGSSGYGEEFTQAVQGDYGGKDMQDLLNGIDAAVERFDFLDGTKVAVNGISYGGFMTNWLITQTDRFYAAISEGCISNWVSMYGTSDISPGFLENEFLGKTDTNYLWSISPLKYVDQVETPLLIIHAEDDLRCPIEQAEQFYSQLKRQEKEVEFLRFPNSSHGFLQIGEPENRVARVEAIIEWATRQLSE